MSYFKKTHLLIGLLFVTLSCLQTTDSSLSDNNTDHPEKNPEWAKEYMELKTSEGYQKPEGFDIYMRNLQHNNLAALEKSALKSIKELGPDNIAGRTRAFVFDQTTKDRYLVGSISGGLWESTDAGLSWHPTDIHDQNVNITSIDQSVLDPNLVYYSTGEVTGNSAGIGGVGLFKSTDAGHTFKLLENTSFIYNRTWRVACSKVDTQEVFLASTEGLSVSRDGGENWEELILSQVTDVETLPNGHVWAGVHSRGLMFSPTGEAGSFTFVGLDTLPQDGFRRIEIAVAPSDTNTVYVAYEDASSRKLLNIYKTTDGGLTWSQLPHPEEQGSIFFNYAWYCLALAVHPTNPDAVLLGSVGMGYSTDGGHTWQNLSNAGHVDRHLIAFDPFDPDKFIIGSDGGLVVGTASEIPFRMLGDLNNGLNITQFYTGTYHPDEDIAMGGTQDNGTLLSQQENQEFNRVFGGDGAFNIINPSDPDNAYVSYQRGFVYRSNDFGTFRTWDYIMGDLDFDSDGNIDDRVYFINPLYLDQTQPDKLFFPTRDRIWTSDNQGDTWYQLTDNIEGFYVVRTKAINDSTTVGFMAGTGVFYRIDNLQDHGQGEEINLTSTIPASIQNGFIKDFCFHPIYDSVLYVSYSSYATQPRVWKVTNVLSDNAKWESVSGDLPVGLPVNGIVVSDMDPDVIILATDYGAYSTADGGIHWTLESEIPNVPIHEVKLNKNLGKLYFYTHGRGIWSAELDLPTATTSPTTSSPGIKLWPNPATDYLQYEMSDSFNPTQAYILKMTGQQHNSFRLSDQSGHIDITHLPPGQYILWLKDKQNRSASTPFVKI